MKPRLLLLSGLAALAVVAGLWWWQREPAAPSATSAATTRRPPTKIPSVVLVNDSRDAVVPVDAPLFVELVVTNPTEQPIDVAFARLGLEVRGASGVSSVTWEALPAPVSQVSAGDSVGLRWVASTTLPAGAYTVHATGLADATTAATFRLAAEPARLRVSADRDDDARQAAEIQLRAWRGDTAGALTDIERALERTPDALVLQLWRADLLRELGREADAQQQWLALGDLIDQRQRRSPRGAPEFPFWLAERLAGR